MIKYIKSASKGYNKTYFLAMCLTFIEVIGEILIPVVMASMIDEGINKNNFDVILKTGMIMVGLAILGLVCGVIAARLAAYSAAGFSANLRSRMFEKIQNFSFSNIDKFSTGNLITRITTDVQNVQQAFQMSMRIATRAPLMLIVSMIMAVRLSGKLSLVFLVMIVFLSLVFLWIMMKARKLFSIVFQQYGDMNQVVQENVSAIRVVKAFVREDFEKKKFYKAAKKVHDLFLDVELKIAWHAPAMELSYGFAVMAISWFGAHMIVSNELTTGQLASILQYIMAILGSLMMLSMLLVMFIMALSSLKRIVEVLEEEIDIVNPSDPVLNVKDGSIDYEDVNFRYKKDGENMVLSNLNFSIESGETVGIIGGTGSGKTSLVNLVSRLYDVTTGSVKVGGIDVRKYDLESLRDSVSVVLQKNTLFSGTIYENLRWGNEKATDEECKIACEIAHADEFIEKLPEGYDSKVEQGGSNFSGGQKQRLCIARALLKNPKVLIFDDSTSAVDNATDKSIQASLSQDKPEVTKIIISQRIQSLESADRIMVIDKGRIEAFAPSDELLKISPIYKEIYESQKSNGNDDFDLEEVRA